MNKTVKAILITVLIVVFLFYILPNLGNQREQDHFSNQKRIALAKAAFLELNKDFLSRPISDFYDRPPFTRWLFGEHYRDSWTQPILLPVFKGFDTLSFHKVGGGMQTTSIEVLDTLGRSFTLRTIDKDQSRILPSFLKYSALRPLLRDQASALNPFNSKIVASLSKEAGMIHTNPQMFLIPFSTNQHDSINFYLAGKVILLEEEPGSKWSNQARFENPTDIVNTEDMLKIANEESYKLDTLAYLKCRLFDILISDWDRHEGQWKWLLFKNSSQNTIQPMPIDRDMAFCRFDDGIINQLVMAVSNKFKSFRANNESLQDAAQKVTDLDYAILKEVDKRSYIHLAEDLSNNLSDEVILKAFQLYPSPIFNQIGEDHINTLIARRSNLTEAAEEFYKHIQK